MENTITSAGKPRALVADDDAAFLILMEQALTEAGFCTACVSDGAKAVEYVLEFEPDLVFLDNLMPNQTGLEACAELRSRLDSRCPPIVVVTSGESDEDITEAFSAGASDYLVKPVNWHLFKHRLSGWLTQVESAGVSGASAKRGSDVLVVARGGDIIEIQQQRDSASLIEEGVVPAAIAELFPRDVCEPLMAAIARVLKTRATDNVSFELLRSGETVNYEAAIAAQGRDKAAVELRPLQRDTASKHELFRLAYIDPVTGVPNRHLFDLAARDRMERARFESRGLTFLCLTFDRLVDAQPDQPHIRNLLIAAAEALSENLRDHDHLVRFDVPDASSPPLASLDGVHFLILLEHAEADDVVDNIVTRIQRICENIGIGNGDQVKLVPRVGVSRFPDDGEDLDQLVDASLLATREARQLRQAVRRFGSNRRPGGSMKFDLETELLHALESGQLSVYYQPRVDLQSGQVVAAEALIRWQHPFRGSVPVAEMFDIAAGAGKVAALTDWAFREACSEVRAWDATPQPVKVSINLSEEQLIRPSFADSVISILEELQIDPATVELEMRESLLDCTDRSLRQLLQLRDVGVGIIVDDFGSERTSLLTLRRLRIDGFKVNHDLARVGSLSGEESGVYTIANAIARARKALLIAKGIESEDELEFVRSRRCDQAQGYHICQPLPASEFRDYLEETRHGGAFLPETAAAI